MKRELIPVTVLAACLLPGCAEHLNQRMFDENEQTQLEKRSYESRIFDTADKEKVMRGVISTLQDLSFVVERADFFLGTVSATRLGRNYQLRMTVSVRPKGSTQTIVRANAQFNVQPVEDPKAYQDFFSSLEKSLFLTAEVGE